jgi:hypothetical protein
MPKPSLRLERHIQGLTSVLEGTVIGKKLKTCLDYGRGPVQVGCGDVTKQPRGS